MFVRVAHDIYPSGVGCNDGLLSGLYMLACFLGYAWAVVDCFAVAAY